MENINRLILEAYYGTLHEGIAENVYRRIKNDVNDQDIDLEEYKLSLDIIQRLLQSKKDKIGQDTLKSWNKQSTDITEVLKSLSDLYSSEDSAKIRQKSNRNSGLKELYARALKAEKSGVVEVVNKKDIMAGKHNLIMIKPLTKEASIDFGCDNWCTSNSRENAEMFKDYVIDGNNNMLYIHLDPVQAKEMDLPKEKYTWAVRYSFEDEEEDEDEAEIEIEEIQDMSNKGNVTEKELNKILGEFGAQGGIYQFLDYTNIVDIATKAINILYRGKEVPKELYDGIIKDSEYSSRYAVALLNKGKEVPEIIHNSILRDSLYSAYYAVALLNKGKEVPKELYDGIIKNITASDTYARALLRVGKEVPEEIVDFISTHPGSSYSYAITILNRGKEVPEKIIDAISKDGYYAYHFATYLIRKGKEVPEKIKKAAEEYKNK